MMNLPTACARAVLLGCAVAMAAAPLFGQSGKKSVALTLDDLPTTGDRPASISRAQIASRILRDLKAAHAPAVYGFVNAGQLDDGPADIRILKMWRNAGYPLGNHTYSHMDLGAHTAAEFEEDIAKDEPLLESQMPRGDWRWLRFPYLQEGDTLGKRRDVRAWLAARHYRVAEVSLDFEDWAWNEPYARCLARRDTANLAWLRTSYIDTATEFIDLGRQMSNAVYGRDIQYVMLLHIGAFETVMLPHLLDLLRDKNFKLVPLSQAESDLAYNDDPDIALKDGATFLEQMMLAKHLAPIPHKLAPIDKLNTICSEPLPTGSPRKAQP